MEDSRKDNVPQKDAKQVDQQCGNLLLEVERVF
jgi:hypothetical protein